MTNPYESPNVPGGRCAPRAPIKWHRQAWQVPLIGLAITVIFNAAGNDLGLGLLGGVIFFISIFAGWIITGIVTYQYFTGRGRVGNLIGAIVANGALTLLVATSVHAVHLARQAAMDAKRREAVEVQQPSSIKPVDSEEEQAR